MYFLLILCKGLKYLNTCRLIIRFALGYQTFVFHFPIIRRKYFFQMKFFKLGKLPHSVAVDDETRHREQVPIYHVAIQTCIICNTHVVHVWRKTRIRRTHLVVLHDGSGLSLGGHIQFSGVPSLPPFAEREISASPVSIRLSASVLLSPPVSLSFALPSVFPSYWRAISVHPKAQRRSRGNTKAVKRRGG